MSIAAINESSCVLSRTTYKPYYELITYSQDATNLEHLDPKDVGIQEGKEVREECSLFLFCYCHHHQRGLVSMILDCIRQVEVSTIIKHWYLATFSLQKNHMWIGTYHVWYNFYLHHNMHSKTSPVICAQGRIVQEMRQSHFSDY